MHRRRKAPLTQHQAIALARRSPKFRTWYAATSVHILAEEDSSSTGISFETQKHFTAAELAATWGLSIETALVQISFSPADLDSIRQVQSGSHLSRELLQGPQNQVPPLSVLADCPR
jgi:hypothetical protein